MKLAGFLLFLLLGRDAMASLEVQISRDKTSLKGVGINIAFLNNSNQKVCVNRGAIGLDGQLTEGMFEIKNGNEKIWFMGYSAIRLPDNRTGLTLMPNQKVTVSLDISTYYDLSKSGIYSIKYETWNIAKCEGVTTGIELKSNTIYFTKKG